MKTSEIVAELRRMDSHCHGGDHQHELMKIMTELAERVVELESREDARERTMKILQGQRPEKGTAHQ